MKTGRRLPKINSTKGVVLPSMGINPHILDEEVDIYEGVRKDGDKYIWKIDKSTGDWVIEMLDDKDLPLVTLPVMSPEAELPSYKGIGKKK